MEINNDIENNIQHIEEGDKGAFFIQINGKQYGEMTYVKVGDGKIIIDHTFIDDELKGKGAGMKLFEQAVTFARSKSLKIIPLCPFVKSIFNKHSIYNDLLYKM